MSAEPLIHPRTFPIQKLKLSMAVGNSKHYKIKEILPRHWFQTAAKSKFDGMSDIIQEVTALTPKVISEVENQLPTDFPEKVSERILSALSRRAKELKK